MTLSGARAASADIDHHLIPHRSFKFFMESKEQGYELTQEDISCAISLVEMRKVEISRQKVNDENELDECQLWRLDGKHKCPRCLFNFKNATNLRKHWKSHVRNDSIFANHPMMGVEDNFECYYCLQGFQTAQSLLSHLESHTDRHMNGKILFECRVCQKSFTAKTGYSSHMITAHKYYLSD